VALVVVKGVYRTNREEEDGNLTKTQRENKPQNTERRIWRKASLPRKRSRSKCIPEEGSEAAPEERNKSEEGNTVWPTGELLESGPTKEERLFNFQELITWEYSNFQELITWEYRNWSPENIRGTSVRTLRWRHGRWLHSPTSRNCSLTNIGPRAASKCLCEVSLPCLCAPTNCRIALC